MIDAVTMTVVDLAAGEPDDWQLLSPDERERADRFDSGAHRHRYVVGRAAVRRALAAAVAAEPGELVFEYSENGRPDLTGHPAVSFNFSNSHQVGLVAISTCGPVGVDIEAVRAGFADLRVAQRSFAAGEVLRLRAIRTTDRDLAFLRCWTRKEALVKAIGAGLASSLRDFEVSFEPGEPARLIHPGALLAGHNWQLEDVSHLVPGHVAAFAVDRVSSAGTPLPAG